MMMPVAKKLKGAQHSKKSMARYVVEESLLDSGNRCSGHPSRAAPSLGMWMPCVWRQAERGKFIHDQLNVNAQEVT